MRDLTTTIVVTDPAPDISIVIVSYEVREYLQACLESIEAACKGLTIEILVVDNASRDGTVERLKAIYPGVNVIASPKNLGFAKGNNLGLQKARGKYLLLLNPDTLVHPDAVRALCEAAQRYPNAIIGPRLVRPGGQWQRSYWGFPTLPWILMSVLGLPARFYRRAEAREYPLDSPAVLRVDWLAGACLFLSRETLETVGYLCEDYFMYMEDIDLCKEASRLGVQAVYYPHAEIVHFGGASSAKLIEHTSMNPWVTEERRNHLTYFRRHHGVAARECVRIAHAVAHLSKPLFNASRRAWRAISSDAMSAN